MFTPDWKAGDERKYDVELDDGYICHVTAVRGDPANMPSVLRNLGLVTGREFCYDGYTADEIEHDLIEQGLMFAPK